jgi:hypothetical protein
MKRTMWALAALIGMALLAAPPPVEGQVNLEPGTLGLAVAPDLSTYLSFRVPELEAALCDSGNGSGKGGPGKKKLTPTAQGLEALSGSTLEALPGALCCGDQPIEVLEAGQDEEPHENGGGGDPVGEDGVARMVLKTSPAVWSYDGSRAQVEATPERFCFDSSAELKLRCGKWTYSVRLDAAAASSQASFSLDTDADPAASAGTFVADLTVAVIFRFVKKGSGQAVEVPDQLSFLGKGRWSAFPGPEIFSSPGPLSVDTDCQGGPDQILPATTNLTLAYGDEDGDGLAEPAPFCLCGADGSGSVCLEPLLAFGGG